MVNSQNRILKIKENIISLFFCFIRFLNQRSTFKLFWFAAGFGPWFMDYGLK